VLSIELGLQTTMAVSDYSRFSSVQSSDRPSSMRVKFLLATLPVAGIAAGQAQAAIVPSTDYLQSPDQVELEEPVLLDEISSESAIQLDVRPETITNPETAIAPAESISSVTSDVAPDVVSDGDVLDGDNGSPSDLDPTSDSTVAQSPELVSGPILVAQAITAAPDGTHTIVTPHGDRLDISGGQLSGDRTNLFHSFSEFGLSRNQSANFIANPQLRNILGRVTGGNPSVIDGLIQVTGGTPDLYLTNPAGMVFGANARLDVPGSFTATTANGIQVNNQWFNATGANNYAELNGTPNGFAFTMSQPGAIVNAGQLDVPATESLTLVGGTVINTGTLEAPNGVVTIAAVPGERLVRVSQAGHLLSLELAVDNSGGDRPNELPFDPLSLPQLLTGSGIADAAGVTVNANDSVQLAGSGQTVQPGDVVVSRQSAVPTDRATLTAGTATLAASHDLTIESANAPTQLQTTGDLNLVAANTLRVRDSATAPVMLQSGEQLTLRGEQAIDVFALNHSTSGLWSGGDMVLQSSQTVQGDAYYTAGGNFRIETLNGSLGNLFSPNDPVIRAAGDVIFSSYTGASLHIFAGGNVTVPGTITITGADPANSINEIVPLSDGTTLAINGSTRPTLDIRAGVRASEIGTAGTSGAPVPTGLDIGESPSGSSISIGAIESNVSNVQVFLTNQYRPNATLPDGEISTGQIDAFAGDVTIDARGGISVGSTDVPAGINIEIDDGDAGDIRLLSSAGNVTVTGELNTSAGNDLDSSNAGDVFVTTRAGNINLATIDQSINSQSNGDAGNTTLSATGGGISVENIQARVRGFGSGTSGNGGIISLTATGDIATGDINTSVGIDRLSGDAGTITITSLGGTVDTTAGRLNAVSQPGNGGDVTISAAGNITTSTIRSSGDQRGGDIRLNSTNGNIDTLLLEGGEGESFVSRLDASSLNGNGGNISAEAAGNIRTGNVDSSSGANGSGGDIRFISRNGAIDTTAGLFDSTADSGNGGLVDLNAEGDIRTGSIISSSIDGNGGDIRLTSRSGAIDTSNGQPQLAIALEDLLEDLSVDIIGVTELSGLMSASILGNGGAIQLNAAGNITTSNLNTVSLFGTSGNIDLTSRNGAIDTTAAQNFAVSTSTTPSTAFVSPTVKMSLAFTGVDASSLQGGGGAIAFTASDIRFADVSAAVGNDSTDSRGGSLTFQAAAPDQALTIRPLTPTALQNGFSRITMGRVDGRAGVILANPLTVQDPLTIQVPFGSIAINGTLRGTGNGSITINGSGSTTTLNADIITVGTPITINDSVILANDVRLDTTSDAAGATITITGTVNGSSLGNQSLALQAGTGNIQLGNAIGSGVPLHELQVLSAQRVDVTGSITTANGDIGFQTVGDRVNVTGSSSFNAGTGTIRFNNADLFTGPNNLTLTANEIDFVGQTQVSGTGQLQLQPATSTLQIALGDSSDTGATTLDLTQTDLNALQNGFASLTIGRADGSGAIAINNSIRFSDPVTLQSPVGNGRITANGTITGVDNASVTVLANRDITLRDVTAPAGISLTSRAGSITTDNLRASSSTGDGGAIALTAPRGITTRNITTQSTVEDGGAITLSSRDGAVQTGDLRSGGAIQGGDVRIEASDRIQTGRIISRGEVGDGGNVLLDPSGNIIVSFIDAQGGRDGIGGTVDITTDRLFLASDRFIDQNGIEASISTAGSNGGGPITIRHGGGGLRVPFNVGDVTISGTAGAITTGTDAEGTIFPFRSFPGSYTQGDIRIITQDPPIAPPQVEQPPSLPTLPPLPVSQPTPLRTLDDAREILQEVEEATGVRPALIYAQFVPAPTPAASWFNEREASFTQQFEEHLQGNGAVSTPLLTAQDTDELELLMVTAEGPPIARRLRGWTRAEVMAIANRFRREVTDVRKVNTRSYLRPAQELYDLLVGPLEADLQARQVENLVFLPDVGLRSVPLAALHDGQHFLVQRYSVGLMPSLSLADTRYVDIRDSQVLAMGASEFTDQVALPAVPVELTAIAQQLWSGETFLNQSFTPETLRAQRQQHPFGIVHLATHAEFEPGTPSNSYIQFWNTQLRLDQLRQLGLNDPPVNLMVLSACRTALGNADAELGFAGLATLAGVKSVMASLWYVSDAGTLTLMTEFYDQLRRAPIKAEALRQAQLLMANGQIHLVDGQLQGLPTGEPITLPPEFAELDSIDFSHPYYWSAFTMVGNPW
jgi:filamentous hemagglutinin family protein